MEELSLQEIKTQVMREDDQYLHDVEAYEEFRVMNKVADIVRTIEEDLGFRLEWLE